MDLTHRISSHISGLEIGMSLYLQSNPTAGDLGEKCTYSWVVTGFHIVFYEVLAPALSSVCLFKK